MSQDTGNLTHSISSPRLRPEIAIRIFYAAHNPTFIVLTLHENYYTRPARSCSSRKISLVDSLRWKEIL